MSRVHVTIAQPKGADAWPTSGHHLSIGSYGAGAGPLKHLETIDLGVPVGESAIDVPAGQHVIRLFSAEGSFLEEQVETAEGQSVAVSFTLEGPRYPYRRPRSFGMLNPAAMDVEAAWATFEGAGWDAISDGLVWKPIVEYADIGLPRVDAAPTRPGLHLALSEIEGHVTVFRLPWSPRADIDLRHYGHEGTDTQVRQHTRLRYVHPDLGMVLPHLAMNQIQDVLPHVRALMAAGALEMMCEEDDACGAMAIAHVLAAMRHEADPTASLRMVVDAFPTLPDPKLLLAYQMLWGGDQDEIVDLVRQALALGPPCFTLSVSTLRDLTYHLEDVADIAARGRMAARVDPGSLFTSVIIR